jgi:hypothetical protein
MLRCWQLEPLILDQLPSEGQTIIEKLEKYTGDDVRFAVVLATPDDEGYARGKADERKYRARQNVVFELGLLPAKLGRSRVAILLEHQDQMERPSDVQGLIYLPFTDSVDETKVLLAKEMDKQGIRASASRSRSCSLLNERLRPALLSAACSPVPTRPKKAKGNTVPVHYFGTNRNRILLLLRSPSRFDRQQPCERSSCRTAFQARYR